MIMGQNDVGDNGNHSVWQNTILYKDNEINFEVIKLAPFDQNNTVNKP